MNLCSYIANGVADATDVLGLYVTHTCCEEKRDAVMDEPAVAALYAELKAIPREDGKPCINELEQSAVQCKVCQHDEGGIWHPDKFMGGEIWLCHGIISGTNSVRETLLHELQHAADWCKESEFDSCQTTVCAEARAHYCSGSCSTVGECKPRARRSASVHVYPGGLCEGKSDAQLEAMVENCGSAEDNDGDGVDDDDGLDDGECHVNSSPPAP